MKTHKIIVKPTSSNFWWGVYGFCEQTGWEDFNLFYDNGNRIGRVSLNTKSYLKLLLTDLEKDEKQFSEAIKQYLANDKTCYYYFYDAVNDDDFYEVPFQAPKNAEGIKPRFIEIWHQDESIGMATVKSSIQEFAKKFLNLDTCEIEIQNIESFENALESFRSEQKTLNKNLQISLSDEVVEGLSKLWEISNK